MKIDLRSLILGAGLVLIGFFMGLMGATQLFAQSFPDSMTVYLHTPGYLDANVRLTGGIDVDVDNLDGHLSISE